MLNIDAAIECARAELSRRYPLTEKQLLARIEAAGFKLGLADVRRLLESAPMFVIAGDRPRCWRLGDRTDTSTSTCTGCRIEKSSGRFRTVTVESPVCFDCEARGINPPPVEDEAAQERGPVSDGPRTIARKVGRAESSGQSFFVDGRAPSTYLRTASGRAAGYLEAWDRLVYVTKGGSAYHLREDCEALRSGQAEAIGTGHRIHRVRLGPAASVGASRHPCSRCAC